MAQNNVRRATGKAAKFEGTLGLYRVELELYLIEKEPWDVKTERDFSYSILVRRQLHHTSQKKRQSMKDCLAKMN